jgi:hypothetical protein
MNRLLKIARSATPGTGVQFRDGAYGAEGIRGFLRDVLALANAPIDGPRYILTGIEIDKKGNRQVRNVPRDDFSGKPSYHSLVADHIEPPLRVKYQPVTANGKRVGVYEIDGCKDQPYMMRIDYSETLRRGDAYMRKGNTVVKLGRRQVQEMFERKFREAVSHESVEVGFPGDIIHKDLELPTADLAQMPSAIAAGKLKQVLDVRRKFANTGETTMMARLTHARLFGSDNPYEHRSTEEIIREVADIRSKHRLEDEYFLYELNPQMLQLVVYNQGDEPIENATLSLVLPNHNSLYVAGQLPKNRKEDRWMDRGPAERAAYPAVNLKDEAIHVSSTLGEVSTDAPVEVFETPLRICVGHELRGRKIGIRYSVFGSNLRRPAKGKLRLIFAR